MLKRLLAPVVVACSLALMSTLALFFAAAATSTPGETTLSVGPLVFMRIVRAKIEAGGSTVAVRPGLGLAVLWVVLLAYGAVLALRRYRQGPDGARPGVGGRAGGL